MKTALYETERGLKRIGRPKVPKDKALSIVISFRVAVGDWESIQHQAKCCGQKPLDWVRDMVVEAANYDYGD